MKHIALFSSFTILATAFSLAERPSLGSVVRHDPAFDKLVAKDATIEVLTSGFVWAEGPVWDKKNKPPSLVRCSRQHDLPVVGKDKEGYSLYS